MKKARHSKILWSLVFGLKDNNSSNNNKRHHGAKSRRRERETRGELRRRGKEADDEGHIASYTREGDSRLLPHHTVTTGDETTQHTSKWLELCFKEKALVI